MIWSLVCCMLLIHPIVLYRIWILVMTNEYAVAYVSDTKKFNTRVPMYGCNYQDAWRAIIKLGEYHVPVTLSQLGALLYTRSPFFFCSLFVHTAQFENDTTWAHDLQYDKHRILSSSSVYCFFPKYTPLGLLQSRFTLYIVAPFQQDNTKYPLQWQLQHKGNLTCTKKTTSAGKYLFARSTRVERYTTFFINQQVQHSNEHQAPIANRNDLSATFAALVNSNQL